jgi:hypothetical protein
MQTNQIPDRGLTQNEIQFQIDKYKEKYSIEIEQYNLNDYDQEYKKQILQTLNKDALNITMLYKTFFKEACDELVLKKKITSDLAEDLTLQGLCNLTIHKNFELERLNAYNKTEIEYQKLDLSKYIDTKTLINNQNIINRLIKPDKTKISTSLKLLPQLNFASNQYFANFILNTISTEQKTLENTNNAKGLIFYENTNQNKSAYHGTSFIINKDKIVLLPYNNDCTLFTKNILSKKILLLDDANFVKLQHDRTSCHVLELKIIKQMLRDDSKLLNTFLNNPENFKITDYPDICKYAQSLSFLNTNNLTEKPMHYGKINIENMENNLNNYLLSKKYLVKNDNDKFINCTLKNRKNEIIENKEVHRNI